MNNLFSCYICDASGPVLLFDAVPKHLRIKTESHLQFHLCNICIGIKMIIDNHISLTTGEKHFISNTQHLIALYEYWSDWTTNMDVRPFEQRTNANLLKIWNSFSFVTGKHNFNSKREALDVMLDYRREHKKNFDIISFRSYQDVLANITFSLSNFILPTGKLNLTIIDDPLEGKCNLNDWIKLKHVNIFLNTINSLY